MYVPKNYLESDWEQAQYLIEQFPLATVVTSSPEHGLIANHIPFYLHTNDDGSKTLHAHMAKVNHQIPSLKASDEVLVIFQSHDAYISPSYYPTKKDTGKVVPTWDFGTVHIYGKPEIIDDFGFVRTQLENFTNQQEKHRDVPWTVDEAPEKYTTLLQKAITGLLIGVGRYECKFKFEQGKPKQDVDGVAAGLAKDNLPDVSKLTVDTNSRYDARKKQAL